MSFQERQFDGKRIDEKVIIFIWNIPIWFYLFTLKNFFHHMPASTPFCGMVNQCWYVLWISPQMSLCLISRLGPNPHHGLSSFAAVFLSGSVTPLVIKSLPEQLTVYYLLCPLEMKAPRRRGLYLCCPVKVLGEYLLKELENKWVNDWIIPALLGFSSVILGQSSKSL